MLLSTLIFALCLTFIPISAKSEDVLTILHTNDMHGRLNQKVDNNQSTRLSRLLAYKEAVQADLMLDAGDAIQGLPISNFDKGKNMISLMAKEIQYDAMAIGNHEFDFGFDHLKNTIIPIANENGMELLSNNTYNTNTNERIFTPYMIKEVNGKQIAIIGTTTPETAEKTHPDNIQGIYFKDPVEETLKNIASIKENNETIDAVIVLAHLGIDDETPASWRGITLAQSLSEHVKEVPVLVIDGHSHSESSGSMIGNNTLYVQTGEYLNNIGHVELNLSDIEKSSIKLVSIEDEILSGIESLKPFLEFERKADEAFSVFSSQIVVEALPVSIHLNGERSDVRTRETNLGNLVADAIYAYGRDFETQTKKKPDFAVTNGGGIRASIRKEKGEALTQGDVITVLPFGNLYSHIEVSGQDIYQMFEHSLRTEIQKDENGNPVQDDMGYRLSANGGFLQISSNIKVKYNPLQEAGKRVLSVHLYREDLNDWILVDRNEQTKKYVVASNDFLTQGGDGYHMLNGRRTEGSSLEIALANYIKFLNTEEWGQYQIDKPQRIIEWTIDENLEKELMNLIINAEKTLDKENQYESKGIEQLKDVLHKVQSDLSNGLLKNNQDYSNAIKNLKDALDELEKEPIVEKHVDDQDKKEISSDENRASTKDMKLDTSNADNNPVKENKLPETGQGNEYIILSSIMVALGGLLYSIARKKG